MSSLMPPKEAVPVSWDMEIGRSVEWRVKVCSPKPAGSKDSREVFHPNEGTGEENEEAGWLRGVQPWAWAGHIGILTCCEGTA